MPNDPFADAMNTSGYAGLIGPNPYLEYTGQIPMAGLSRRADRRHGQSDREFHPGPTAARRLERRESRAGRAAAGTTLNSTPQPGVIPFQHATMPDGMPYGQTSLGRGVTGTSWQGPGGGTRPAKQAHKRPRPPRNKTPSTCARPTSTRSPTRAR